MGAGASMSHPSLPAIIITPICPRSLSFRPIMVPAGVQLQIKLNANTRHPAWFSVDGTQNKQLPPGFTICVSTSEYPLLSMCRSGQIDDWFEGLRTCLQWNMRKLQLPMSSTATSLASYFAPIDTID